MKLKVILCLVTFIIVVSTACSPNVAGSNAISNGNQAANAGSRADVTQPSRTGQTPAPPTTAIRIGGGQCDEQKLPGMRFIKAQTFPVNFKPFEASCFVTFGNEDQMLDEKDLPRGSRFYIYKDGKQVSELPDAFGREGCWIAAAAFKDLNGDGLTDIVIAGKCLGAKDSYPSNAVYENTGSAFTTDDDANLKLDELKTVKEIEAFVKKNISLFF